MTPKGKGFFIWRISDCENGDANAIANLAQQADFNHALIKLADRTSPYNYDSDSDTDLVLPVAQALRARGIQVWGWHYIYGDEPIGEADIAIQRVQQINPDVYVLDVEKEFKEPGKSAAADKFMDRLRASLPSLTVALCSYRFPSYHPQIPWQTFLESCDLNMPQVYWEFAHNPIEQLTRSVREFQAMTPYRPIIPVGSAYKRGGWSPTPGDVQQFLQTAQDLNLSAANFWEWSHTRRYLPEVWDAVKDYSWSTTPLPKDITQQYIAALNTHHPDQVLNLYSPTALHVSANQTIQGAAAIRSWYQSVFNQLLPNATFTHTGFSGTGSSRHFTWTATSTAGNVYNGNDTFGLVSDKITYHYTFFSVS